MKKILLFALLAVMSVIAKAQETDVTTLDWTQKGQGCTKDFNNSEGGTVFGTDAGGTNLSYVDVSAYGQIKLYGTPNQTARLFVNREEIGDKGIIFVDINEEGVGVYDFNNLLALQPTIQYIHLNGVKASAHNTKLNLSKITVSGDPIPFPEDVWTCPEGETDYTTLPGYKDVNNIGSTLNGGDVVYGDQSNGDNYTDVTAYETVKFYGTPGAMLRIFVNRVGGGSVNFGTTEQRVTISEDGVGTLDVQAVMTATEKNFCRLSGIKVAAGDHGATVFPVVIKGISVIKVYPFDATEADITTFDFNNAENYDLEAGKFTANGGWTFAEPKDFSHYKWLVVTTTYNASQAGGEFRISDAAGNSIGGEDYAKGGGVSRGSMWIDRWNNQICATVSMAYIADKGIDITKIASVSFSANQPISAVYLTNYEAGQAISNKGSWGSCAGDYIREYSNIAENGSRFGTIALKYAAAVSGAYVYTVDAFDPEVGLTISRHYGVLEAGAPYIFEAIDEVGLNGAGENCNVNFFRVDENAVSGDWSDNKARDNGLVGYYDGGFWPGAGALTGCYLIANNKMVKINGGTVDLGKNRCFFDPEKCTNKSGASNAKTISFVSDVTAINNVNINESLTSGKIYDISGREVKSMQKGGMYIMGGMKVNVK